MEPTITIDGLSKRQSVLADVLWTMDTPEQVNAFIDCLSGEQQQDARTVLHLMTWAMLDTVQDTNLAEEVLEKYL